MPPLNHPKIAVIADAHFHDTYGDYGLSGGGAGDTSQMAVRRLAETARSTRVFNESHAALHFVLNDIVARNIYHVVLLGDYSDDGQHATLVALRRILDHYAANFGIRFYALPGNHDVYGADGRHRTKRFLNPTGGFDIATSNPKLVDAKAGRIAHSDANYCYGYPKALQMLPDIGFFGSPDVLHWETPFGGSANPANRSFPVQSIDGLNFPPLMDASYLVEPSPGIWLLMVDANVFIPHSRTERMHHDEDYADSTAAGWNAMLAQKPFILSWMKDVALRATQLNKQLLTFSHYPILDPLDGTADDERALLGTTSMSERIPDLAVAKAVLDTGIKIHFHGHVHVNDTARYRQGERFLVNVSVPSLVAFPAGYKIIDPVDDVICVETVEIAQMPLNPKIEVMYRTEVAQTGLKADRLLGCKDYGDFLYQHLGHLVSRRHLRRDWPENLAAVVKILTLADLVALAMSKQSPTEDELLDNPAMLISPDHIAHVHAFETSINVPFGFLANVAVLAFLEDWYRLRMGSDLAYDKIPSRDVAIYNALADHYAKHAPVGSRGAVGRFALLFEMFKKLNEGLPSRDFDVNLNSGDIIANAHK